MSLCDGDLSYLPVPVILKHCAVSLSISARYQEWRYKDPGDLLSPRGMHMIDYVARKMDVCGSLPPDSTKALAAAAFGLRIVKGPMEDKRRRGEICYLPIFASNGVKRA